MAFTPLACVGTLVFTFANLLKYLCAKDWSAALTQVVGGLRALPLFLSPRTTSSPVRSRWGYRRFPNLTAQLSSFLVLSPRRSSILLVKSRGQATIGTRR